MYFLIIAAVIIAISIFFYFYTGSSNPPENQESSTLLHDVRSQLNLPTPQNSPSIVNYDCPICLGQVQYPVQTNCGHIFCGNCIVMYWKVGRWALSMKCPSCRQNVTLLMRCFNLEDLPREDSIVREMLKDLHRYNKRNSNEPLSFLSYITDAPTIISNCLRELFTPGRYQLEVALRIRMIIIILFIFSYLFIPFDVFPESFFGVFGFLDDIFICLIGLIHMSNLFRQNVVHMDEIR